MKIAVVTGASSGMGREMIIQLWEHFKGFDEKMCIRDSIKARSSGRSFPGPKAAERMKGLV